MNFLRDSLVQFIIITLISLVNAIAAVKAVIPRKERTHSPNTANVQPPRVRTRRGCIMGSIAILATMIGMFYLTFIWLIEAQTHIFSDPTIITILCGIGLILGLFFIILTIGKLIRGEYQPQQLMQELQQPIHPQSQQTSKEP